MVAKRINSPEAKIILDALAVERTCDYLDVTEWTGLHPTNARRHLKALHEAGKVHICDWRKDRLKPGPLWPVYAPREGDDAPYPGEEIKRQRNVRRQFRERPHMIDPILVAMKGAK